MGLNHVKFTGKPLTKSKRDQSIWIWLTVKDPQRLELRDSCWKFINVIILLSIFYLMLFTYSLQSIQAWQHLAILVVGTSLTAWLVLHKMAERSIIIVFKPTMIKIKIGWFPFWKYLSRQGGVGVSINTHELAAEKQGHYARAIQLLIETLNGTYEFDLVGEAQARQIMKRIQAVNTVMNQQQSVDRGMSDQPEERARQRPSFG